jgi:hypothetical protein
LPVPVQPPRRICFIRIEICSEFGSIHHCEYELAYLCIPCDARLVVVGRTAAQCAGTAAKRARLTGLR